MSSKTVYAREEQTFPFLIRVIWFFLLGWHLTLYWIVIAWALNVTVIGLPLGLWMLNRVPLVLTLRSSQSYRAYAAHGTVVAVRENPAQPFFVLRTIYFILIGWWFSLVWSLLAWLLSVSIIGLPFGIWMFNRLPNVTTLMNQ